MTADMTTRHREIISVLVDGNWTRYNHDAEYHAAIYRLAEVTLGAADELADSEIPGWLIGANTEEAVQVPSTWTEILTHPDFADLADDEATRSLFDSLEVAHGWEKASSLWQTACTFVDHVAEDHDGGECDCA